MTTQRTGGEAPDMGKHDGEDDKQTDHLGKGSGGSTTESGSSK
jgi:hypothetical protein